MINTNPLAPTILTDLLRTNSSDPIRVTRREGSTLEFKESYSHAGMAQYFKTIAAFANNLGGYIVFGVSDKPRKLLGLKERNLKQFEELKVEEFTKNLLDYFSPEIKWDHFTFEYKNLKFGIIYTYPLKRKPCICKKNYDSNNPKYSLKEGDIYYRYGGRSERIHFEELNTIIDSTRQQEEQQWLDFIKRAAKVGINNASVLDLNSGVVTGSGGSIVIDETLLSKIAFIKEGEFVETKGTPTLRLIGDVERIDTGKIIVKESTKNVIRAIEPDDIIRAFLQDKDVDNPMEYLRSICSATTANYPFYFLLKQAKASTDDAVQVVMSTKARGQTKQKLLDRLAGRMIPPTVVRDIQTYASIKKKAYRYAWRSEEVETNADELGYCLNALMSLEVIDVQKHEPYIKRKMLEIYDEFYETAKTNVATDLRKALCRIDEVLFFEE